MAAFVLFQIYFLQQLEKYHDKDQDVGGHIPWNQPERQPRPVRTVGGAVGQVVAKKPPRPNGPPPVKTTLLPKHGKFCLQLVIKSV